MISLAEAAEETVPEAEPDAVEFHALSDSGIAVDAIAPAEAFPAGTVMTVTDVPREEALEAVSIPEEREPLDAVAVDISFRAEDGSELEPDAGVRVTISIPEELRFQESDGYSLFHIADSGDVQEVGNVCIAEGTVSFASESFSVFMVLGWQQIPSENLIMANGQVGGNSSSTPFEIYVGDDLAVFMNCNSFYVPDNESGGVKKLDAKYDECRSQTLKTTERRRSP